MKTPHNQMTARVVSLDSAEAGDGRVGGTIAERIAVVSTLSAELWNRTGQPLPVYTRSTLPIVITRLRPVSECA